MKYATPEALRMALGQRHSLLRKTKPASVSIDYDVECYSNE
jgi:hypothetical protein